ncbi:MAG: EpsG family protein [Erysipelotrichaceae bacterium]|nr:EpsG family protein [Erysipelotrichaceae bacterium]
MTIYIILYLYVVLLGLLLYKHKNSNGRKKLFLFLSFSAMALVIGLRGASVGEDTAMYLGVFEKANNVQWSDIFSRFFNRTVFYTYSYGYSETIESGYLALSKLFQFISNDGHLFLLFIASLTCILFAKFIYENSEDVFFSTLIFLCESMFMFAFNGMRQLLAVSIAVQAYVYIKKKENIKAFLIFLLAFVIHNTSIVCLLLFLLAFIPEKKQNKVFKYILIGAIALPFVINAFSGIITRFLPRYASYFSNNYWGISFGGSTLILFFEFFLVYLARKKKFKGKDSFNTTIIIIAFLSIQLMGLKITMFDRLSYYFRAFLIIWMPSTIRYFKDKDKIYVKLFAHVLLFFLYISMARTPVRLYQFYF